MLLFNNNIGRFGNQMFLYAAAISYSKRNNKPICFTDLELLKYFKLSISDNYFNKLKKSYFLNILFRYKKLERANLLDNWVDQFDALNNLNSNKEVWGYFQGEWYFKDNVPQVLRRLQIKKTYQHKFQKIKKLLSKKPLLTIHVRRGDYKEFSLTFNGTTTTDLQIPVNYYKSVLNKFDLDKFQLVFISDCIDLVKKDFNEYDAYFSPNEFIIDFQFLTNAEICILSNSSFSWWGAYLNNNENKKIYIPKYYCGFKIKKEFPINIIPNNWNQIDVI
ncbi:MAG: alpha-1,2-fucosyltransferase [Chitinophagales bacterium]